MEIPQELPKAKIGIKLACPIQVDNEFICAISKQFLHVCCHTEDNDCSCLPGDAESPWVVGSCAMGRNCSNWGCCDATQVDG